MNAFCVIPLSILVLGITACQGCWLPSDVVSQTVASTSVDDSFACTPTTAKRQLDHFLGAIKVKPHTSACAEHWWLRDVAEGAELKRMASGQHARVMDVGCNKAYFSAAALNHLAPDYGDHLQQIYKLHLSRDIYKVPCGACSECKQGGGVSSSTHPDQADQVPDRGTVDVFCYEPSEVHVESLLRARDALYGTPSSSTAVPEGAAASPGQRTRVNFHVHHEAVSNRTGTALFPGNCTVNTCMVRSSASGGQSGMVEVNITTVDNEMRAMGSPFLNVLKIDTEGFDPSVLAGAYYSLRDHRIGVVSFEYHNIWKRSGASLRQCVSYLDNLGYACYYDAAVTARISGSCWLDDYELWFWSNVVCALQGGTVEAALQEASYLAEEKRQRNQAAKDFRIGRFHR